MQGTLYRKLATAVICFLLALIFGSSTPHGQGGCPRYLLGCHGCQQSAESCAGKLTRRPSATNGTSRRVTTGAPMGACDIYRHFMLPQLAGEPGSVDHSRYEPRPFTGTISGARRGAAGRASATET